MSDRNTTQKGNFQSNTGKKLVKVKRLKPKNNSMPKPEQPSLRQNYSDRSLTTLARPNAQLSESYIDEEYNFSREQNYNEPQYIQDDEDYANQNTFLRLIYEQPTKILALASILCFIIGFGIAKLTTTSTTNTVREGLQGVVVNPEVPKGRARCGLVDRTQGCVIYIMNPQRQDLNARDFFDLAAKQTGRQRFVIDTSNMRYSSIKIKPGAIAQINIPPLQ